MAEFSRSFHAKLDDQVRSVCLRRFGGLELREGAISLDPCRSPDALNMLLDADGLPRKRPGYKAVRSFASYGGRIYGLHNMVMEGEERLLIHAGSKLWLLRDNGFDQLADSLNEAPSSGFAAGGSYFLMDGVTIHRITGRQVGPALASPYVPITRRRAAPSGAGGRGEGANLLTAYRRNSFVTDGETADFHLDAYPVAGSVTAELQSGEILTEGQGLTVYRHAARVTFRTPPSAGEEGVTITFEAAGRPLGHAEAIGRTRIYGRFGEAVFLTGNPDFPAYEWGSTDMARAYFPETLCGFVGDRGTPIAGYLQHRDALVVLKRPGNDHSLYLRTGDSPPRPGGDGPAATRSIGRLGGHSLYLAREGVMEVVSSSGFTGRSGRCVSAAIGPLIAAGDMDGAEVFIHGDGCYIAQGESLIVGQLVGEAGRERLEWNHWRPVEAGQFARWKGGLCFSRGERLYRFCDPDEAEAHTDAGEAIAAHWTTPVMDMGDILADKRLTDIAPTLRAGSAGEMEVLWRGDGSDYRPVGEIVAAGTREVRRLRPGVPSARQHQLKMVSTGAGDAMCIGPLSIHYRRAFTGR